jgi:hypothetical protein
MLAKGKENLQGQVGWQIFLRSFMLPENAASSLWRSRFVQHFQ